jgi:hypothetical protein
MIDEPKKYEARLDRCPSSEKVRIYIECHCGITIIAFWPEKLFRPGTYLSFPCSNSDCHNEYAVSRDRSTESYDIQWIRKDGALLKVPEPLFNNFLGHHY